MSEPLDRNMRSPLWRIRNIYTIRSVTGTPIPFRPNPEQEQVLHAIYILGWEFIIIPKARQLGMSTLLAIIILDSMLFGSGIQSSIVDATGQDAKKKLDEKIKYGWEHLPQHIRDRYEVPKSNEDEWRVALKPLKEDDNEKARESWVFAGERARGGTNQILWISEWGTIGLSDKQRSTEILTGALPTAEHPGCITIVETTWKGGRQGDLWPIVAQAQRTPEAMKTTKDPRILFFAWWTNPQYRDAGDPSQITPATHEYFGKLQVLTKKSFDSAQRLWWQKMGEKLGMFMAREYPSTLDECFDAPTEGAFFDKVGLEYIHQTVITRGPFVRYCDIHINGGAAQYVVVNERAAPFRIWEDPREGLAYILSADFCVGKMAVGSTGKRDANSWSVWRAAMIDPVTREKHKAMKVAACCLNDRTPTPEAVRRIKALAKFYGNCMVIPEINNKDDICGQLMAEPDPVVNMWSQSMGVDGAMPGTTRTETVYGWLTSGDRTGGGSRRHMLATLQLAVMQQELIIPDERMDAEMCTFIINEKGKAEAAPGCFDDSVLEGAIGVHNINHARPYVAPGLQSSAHVRGDDLSLFAQGVTSL